MPMGAPYTDVRVHTPDISVYDLRGLPGLMTINLRPAISHPDATGPQVEFVFGTEAGCDPADETLIRQEVERWTRRPVLAVERHN